MAALACFGSMDMLQSYTAISYYMCIIAFAFDWELILHSFQNVHQTRQEYELLVGINT